MFVSDQSKSYGPPDVLCESMLRVISGWFENMFVLLLMPEVFTCGGVFCVWICALILTSPMVSVVMRLIE